MKREFVKYEKAVEMLKEGFEVRCFRNTRIFKNGMGRTLLGKQWTLSDDKNEYQVHYKTIEKLMKDGVIESKAPYKLIKNNLLNKPDVSRSACDHVFVEMEHTAGMISNVCKKCGTEE